jgi:hypothetical protein
MAGKIKQEPEKALPQRQRFIEAARYCAPVASADDKVRVEHDHASAPTGLSLEND